MRMFFKLVLREWHKDQVLRHAAAVAYYTVFTLPASMLLILLIAGRMIGRQTVESEVFRQMSVLMGEDLTSFIRSTLENIQAERPSSLMGIVGVFLIILGATGVFRELRYALNKILQSEQEKGGKWERLQSYALSLFLIFIASVILLSSVFVGIFLRIIEGRVTEFIDIPLITLNVINLGVTFGALCLLFFLLYLVLPSKRFPALPVFMGSLFTSVLFLCGTYVLTLYVSYASIGEAYGVAASVLVLLLWVHYSAVIFLLGAELIDAYVRLHGRKRPLLKLFMKARKLLK